MVLSDTTFCIFFFFEGKEPLIDKLIKTTFSVDGNTKRSSKQSTQMAFEWFQYFITLIWLAAPNDACSISEASMMLLFPLIMGPARLFLWT